ncbi:MAG: YidB family protein, partial [Candidatus Binatia bacterium]
MGVLDDLLGQLAGAATANRPRETPVQAGNTGIGMSTILMALLPVVLAMLRNRGGNAPSAQVGQASTGGGLGDLLGQVLGGTGSGGGGGAGGGLGGLGAILDGLQRAGFGEQARSWVSSGENQPLPSGALEQIFGQGGLAEIARRAGLSEADTSRGLAQLMPEVVNHVTPNGEVPQGDD